MTEASEVDYKYFNVAPLNFPSWVARTSSDSQQTNYNRIKTSQTKGFPRKLALWIDKDGLFYMSVEEIIVTGIEWRYSDFGTKHSLEVCIRLGHWKVPKETTTSKEKKRCDGGLTFSDFCIQAILMQPNMPLSRCGCLRLTPRKIKA